MNGQELIDHMERWFDETSAKMRAIDNEQGETKLRIEGMEFAIREVKRFVRDGE